MTGRIRLLPWESRRFRLGAVISPLLQPGAAAVHPLDPPAISTSVPTLPTPELSWDFCLCHPPHDAEQLLEAQDTSSDMLPDLSGVETRAFPCTLDSVPVEDVLLTLLGQGFPQPEIEVIVLLIPKPERAGKAYGAGAQKPTQPQFVGMERTCVHGLTERTCAHCAKRRQDRAEKTAPQLDPFDVIFPLLQPPLGEDFDNPVVFPKGESPFPFQRIGIKFLAEHPSALLADEMGLGKSIQAIVALRLLFRQARIRSVLVVCKKSLLSDWEHKLWKWAPELGAVRMDGSREQRDRLWGSGARVLIINYERLREDMLSEAEDGSGPARPARHVDVVILDEAQTIKNPATGLHRAVMGIHAPVRWALTGTPLENRPEDLVAIFSYIKPGLLKYGDSLDPGRIRKTIEPYFLRRRKVDVMKDLPPLISAVRWLTLTPEQRLAYDRAESEGVLHLNALGEAVTVQHVWAVITRLKQLCNMDPATGASCKLEWLEDHLEEVVAAESKALVFSQYPDKTLRLLLPRLARFHATLFDGSLSQSARDRMLDDFSKQDDKKVLLMSVQAGGLGLTLTSASDVCHFDHWWNPAVARQAEARAHRYGQKKSVFVNSLFVEDTIEQRISELLERKTTMFKEYMDDLTDSGVAQSLSEDELFGLFGIRPPVRRRSTTTGAVQTGLIDLATLTATGFEQTVASLYKRLGYVVRLTPATHDRGIDLYAYRETASGRDTLAIQCKHYFGGSVGVEHARQLYGVIQAEPSITKGVLVTSGRFSSECRDFAQRLRLDLCDAAWVTGMIARHGA